MNKEQFEALKKLDKIRHKRGDLQVYQIDIEEGIIYIDIDGGGVRYENCELVEQDKLVEYLNDICGRFYHSDHTKIIRSIVREAACGNAIIKR